MNISEKDRLVLRDLARKTAELAHSPRNERLYQDWLAYGGARLPARPMIRIEINTFEQDVLPPLMRCEGAEAREIEKRLLRPLANFQLFEDDTLVPDYYAVADHLSFTPFGIEVRVRQSEGLGHHFIPSLHDLEEDWHLLGPSRFGVDEEGAEREALEAAELFGDLLPVRRISNCAVACLTQDIVHIMDMDDMYVAMIDQEERFHAMMRRLTDDYTAFFTMLAQGGHLRSAARMQHLNQGTYCFTEELPDDVPGADLRHLWLFMDSQETAGISPEMYRDLVFPYYRELMARFGLISYGCCEPVHDLWNECLSTVPNLRKVSVSPWCHEEMIGEKLQGTGITYLRKPPATLLGLGDTLDEAAVTACARKTLKAARGCKLEFIQRDVYELHAGPEKVKKYVDLFRRAF